MNLSAIQAALQERNLDGWLFYDHHLRDPLAYRILGLDAAAMVTRRWYYFIPAHGEPRKLVHRIEAARLDPVPGTLVSYASWQDLERELESMLQGAHRIAMQYSPRNAIMYVSLVDGGTLELLRSFNKEIVTSADLISQFEAVLTESQMASHYTAAEKIDRILQAGWDHMGQRARSGGTDEFAISQFMLEAMNREGLVTDHSPNVSVGPHSADSHYDPTAASTQPIRRGDFVLIDIFGKLNQPDAIFYDICWTGVVDREPTDREQNIFSIVRQAREASVTRITEAFATQQPIAGYAADDAARHVIEQAGFGQWFTHRTGHNIGISIHGNGAHLDNLETHDERLILPNTCFSVEPGIYFPGEFGVRSEVDMLTRNGKAEVTGRIQTTVVRI